LSAHIRADDDEEETTTVAPEEQPRQEEQPQPEEQPQEEERGPEVDQQPPPPTDDGVLSVIHDGIKYVEGKIKEWDDIINANGEAAPPVPVDDDDS